MSLARVKDLLVLGLLRAHPLHGYGIVQALEQGLGPAAGLRRAAVYTALGRMADRGWIARSHTQVVAGPERETFSVTPVGEAAYADLVRTVVQNPAPGTQPLAVLISVLDDLPPEARTTALDGWLAVRQARRAALAAFPPHPGGAGAALSLLVRVLEVEIDVLRGLREAEGAS